MHGQTILILHVYLTDKDEKKMELNLNFKRLKKS